MAITSKHVSSRKALSGKGPVVGQSTAGRPPYMIKISTMISGPSWMHRVAKVLWLLEAIVPLSPLLLNEDSFVELSWDR